MPAMSVSSSTVAFRGVEGVVERLFQRGEIGQHGMIAVGRGRFQELRQALREPAQVRMLGRTRLDVGVSHLVEHLVAEIEMQQFVVVAHGLDQPRAIGVAIDTVQRLALLPWAVEDFGQHRIVVGQNAALKIGLLPREVAHPACLPSGGKTFSAISRVLADLDKKFVERRDVVVALDHGRDPAEALQRRDIEIPDILAHRMVVGVDDVGAHVAVAGHVKLHDPIAPEFR